VGGGKKTWEGGGGAARMAPQVAEKDPVERLREKELKE